MDDAPRSMAQTLSKSLALALGLPNGARFFRCALQVNPFGYVQRHAKATAFTTEADYNAAMIAECQSLGIEVIAVTDHYRVDESASLVSAARAAGLYAFSGFEAVTKEGVHFLCLFDATKDAVALERIIGECGVHDRSDESPPGSLDCLELLERCAHGWEGVCVAAHVAGNGGLLRKLSGKPRANVWRSENLKAVALAGPIDQAPAELRHILENKDPAHARPQPLAIINAQDVCDPSDLRRPGSTSFIKMSAPSIEGLRQAFLDAESRIRLNTDPTGERHAEFVAISWEGGFLSDAAIHFNENLNVLVGGRGTGKSTMIESLRYVLGLAPLGEEARRAHEGVLKQVLRSGTRISLLVRSPSPADRCYTIERTVPNPPVVRDETGAVLALAPRDVMPGVEIYGQHEISELTKSREKLTLLLSRFRERQEDLGDRKAKLRLELERSRNRIGELHREIRAVEERLAALPGLEETLKRFQEAGLESKLKQKSLLVREERVFSTLESRLEPIRDWRASLNELIPLDLAFLSPKALEDLPHVALLTEATPVLAALGEQLEALGKRADELLAEADRKIADLRRRWEVDRQGIEAEYERLLRELQKSKVDGEEFIRLRRQIEELRPLRERREALLRDLAAQDVRRRNLVAEWEDIKASDYRADEKAAQRVSRKLRDRVKVQVVMGGNREPLERLLRDEIGGNLTATFERFREREQLSLPDLAAQARAGREALAKAYGLSAAAAERIASADPNLIMKIEELELPSTTQIELNTAPEGEPAQWQTLEALSTGQKATAVLLLLLLESEYPLVVDQPEDDLDNRFITEGVVPTMRQEKRRRQFVFSTHNANIPVLGDAELIVGLSAAGEDRGGRDRVPREAMGSIDAQPVRELVEEILEGGKTAFEMRRAKYGF